MAMRFSGLRGALLVGLWGTSLSGQQTAGRHDALRELKGRHVTLVTDIPAALGVDQLPEVFDLAVPQWAAYFQVDPSKAQGWRVRGYLIRDATRFRQAGLLPDNLPPFLYGFQRGDEFWVLEQPGEYYLRHLMLHEGTHAWMRATLGGTGPPWYMEGVAELLATHRWQDGQLTLNYFPRQRDEVPYWGRIKIIQDALVQNRALSLGDVVQLPPQRFREVDAYGWAWAAAAFLDGHPRWRSRFRELPSEIQLPDELFSSRFWRTLRPSPREEAELAEAWQLFLHHVDYGYSPAEDQVEYHVEQAITKREQRSVAVDRGWQSTGLRLTAGQSYRVTAEGRYQLATEPRIWWSEPQGVTLEYYAGLPLGMLVGAVRGPLQPGEVTPLIQLQPLGAEGVLRPIQTGVLFLQVNERAGRRADNRGRVQVWIEPLSARRPD